MQFLQVKSSKTKQKGKRKVHIFNFTSLGIHIKIMKKKITLKIDFKFYYLLYIESTRELNFYTDVVNLHTLC